MKNIPVECPIISLFFLNARIGQREIPVVIKKVKKEVYLVCFLQEEEVAPKNNINMKMISSVAPFKEVESTIEEGIFACEKGEDSSNEFKSGFSSFKPAHISLTHNTPLGDKISLQWFDATWEIFEAYQNLPGISLSEIFF